MSGVASEPAASAPAHWHQRPRWIVLPALGLVLAAIAGIVLFANGTGRASGDSVDNGSVTSLATVTRRTLSAQQQVSGTLGYSGAFSVVNQAQGVITALPAAGQIVAQGQPLYRVNGSPVILLYGSTPAYRRLAPGASGADVRELNADLVALGYAPRATLAPKSNSFGSATVAALKKLQAHLGLDQTGSLPLGEAVFLPSAARITAVRATLGAPAPPGMPLLEASSTTRQVSVALDPSLQSEVKVGNRVTITLPNQQTMPGIISSVGTVATVSAGSSGALGGSGGSPSITVDIRPTLPAATGTLDQAPVQVSITSATVTRALVVPVTALLALANGGYAIETVEHRVHHLVPVTLGLFDDANGLVQVEGSGVAAGQRVVVPST